VQFQQCRYSVPYALVRQQLWLRATQTTVRIYQDQEMVAIHSRLFRKGRRSTLPDHLPPEARAFLMHDPQWCLKQAHRVGPACHQLIQALFSDRVLDNLRAAQGVVGLKKRYGPARLEAACQRALTFSNPRYRSVKTILDKGLDQQLNCLEHHGTLSAAYTGSGRFCRDTGTLLT